MRIPYVLLADGTIQTVIVSTAKRWKIGQILAFQGPVGPRHQERLRTARVYDG